MSKEQLAVGLASSFGGVELERKSEIPKSVHLFSKSSQETSESISITLKFEAQEQELVVAWTNMSIKRRISSSRELKPGISGSVGGGVISIRTVGEEGKPNCPSDVDFVVALHFRVSGRFLLARFTVEFFLASFDFFLVSKL